MVPVLPSPEVPAAPAVGTLLFSCVLCERCSFHALSRGGGAGFSWLPQPGCEPVCFSVVTPWNPQKTLEFLRLAQTAVTDHENLHVCAGEGLIVFFIWLWIITVVPDT